MRSGTIGLSSDGVGPGDVEGEAAITEQLD